MVRYRGPKVRIIRRLGILPGLSTKRSKHRKRTPGEHGKFRFSQSQRSSLSGDYKERLLEKQKLRFNYGVTENQLISYYKKAKKEKESTGSLLLKFLESRLDCIVCRLGFSPTIPGARQLINHGHILVNDKLVNIPSFLCDKGDVISVKSPKPFILSYFEEIQKKRKTMESRLKKAKFTKRNVIRDLLPSHLELSQNSLSGKLTKSIKRANQMVYVKDLKVVEYYSL